MMVMGKRTSRNRHIEIIEDKRCPGDWRVEAIGPDGEVHVAIFSGPEAKTEAEKYLVWRYG